MTFPPTIFEIRSCYVAWTDFKLDHALCQPPICSDHMHVPPHSTCKCMRYNFPSCRGPCLICLLSSHSLCWHERVQVTSGLTHIAFWMQHTLPLEIILNHPFSSACSFGEIVWLSGSQMSRYSFCQNCDGISWTFYSSTEGVSSYGVHWHLSSL